jgi:hypothetical protein
LGRPSSRFLKIGNRIDLTGEFGVQAHAIFPLFTPASELACSEIELICPVRQSIPSSLRTLRAQASRHVKSKPVLAGRNSAIRSDDLMTAADVEIVHRMSSLEGWARPDSRPAEMIRVVAPPQMAAGPAQGGG